MKSSDAAIVGFVILNNILFVFGEKNCNSKKLLVQQIVRQ